MNASWLCCCCGSIEAVLEGNNNNERENKDSTSNSVNLKIEFETQSVSGLECCGLTNRCSLSQCCHRTVTDLLH